MKLRILASAVALAAAGTVAAATAHSASAVPTPAAAPAAHRAAAAPAAAHAAAPAKPAAAPRVLVVRPGQLVNAGHGQYLKLTRTERCVGTPPEDWSTCKSVVDGNQPAGTVSLQSSGDASGTLYSPLYIGDGRAARMTVTVQGATYDARVVTLGGHPGYATGYAWGAPTSGFPGEKPEVTVYDAAGTVLAQF
ncbi:hypothetical protein NMG29_00570 [Streptomyces cocklensis]|jgi:hypothetical protein|uniref:Secreted protein n=1 Tax=Actinacidiphila cocklensis TaxID=887465 RepID=A0A9W4GUZ3_9ACTN|nr:hypothetical protein [Actinacidiphila cocklensis]MDD1056743.1 hypothetical protein [Actinacidiphila cocklensis]WSX77899.1 hypothetical protein OH826_31085 [Streptomyces sp. NBC_00899]CAG6397780.1 conserved exported hypothetical protein [Actinacidiphila cocklensis]